MTRSALGWLDSLVPKDTGSRRVASGIAYGPGPRQRFDLYAPAAGSGPWPLMLFCYGGGWDSGERVDYSFAGRAFAAMGLVTAVADYRVFPEALFPTFVDDLGLAADWLLRNAAGYGGDPSRVLLAGHSAGAYNAVMLALQPARFGAPGLAGVVRGVVGLSGPYDFHPYDVDVSIRSFGHDDDPGSTQPVRLVTPSAPPMLLAHGVRDRVVGDYHTVRLAAKLCENGVPVVERHYRWLRHAPVVLGLMRPLRAVLPVYADIAAFVAARK